MDFLVIIEINLNTKEKDLYSCSCYTCPEYSFNACMHLGQSHHFLI